MHQGYILNLRLVLLFVLVISHKISQGQTHVLTVHYLQGKAEVKSKKKWVDIKVSDRLGGTDEVRLDRNAVLHLIDSAGRPVLLSLPGIYRIDDLFDDDHPSSVIVLSDQVYTNKRRINRNFFGSAQPIKVLLPQDSTFGAVYAKQFVVRWIDKEDKGPYLIAVKTLFKETIATFESDGHEILFNLDDERFLKERVFYFVISSKADPKYKSAEHVVKRIVIHERFRIDDILAKEIILDNSRALDQLVLAGFFEEKGLLVDAVNAYLESIRLGVDDPAYTEAFAIFLQRLGLDIKK